jgi:hypothetical protein
VRAYSRKSGSAYTQVYVPALGGAGVHTQAAARGEVYDRLVVVAAPRAEPAILVRDFLEPSRRASPRFTGPQFDELLQGMVHLDLTIAVRRCVPPRILSRAGCNPRSGRHGRRESVGGFRRSRSFKGRFPVGAALCRVASLQAVPAQGWWEASCGTGLGSASAGFGKAVRASIAKSSPA